MPIPSPTLSQRIQTIRDHYRNLPWIVRTVKAVRIMLDDLLRFNIFDSAMAMAYTSITSLVPVLAAIFSVITLFKPLMGKEGALVNTVRTFILENLTTGAEETAIKYLNEFIAGSDITKVGITGGIVGFVLLISLLRQIELTFNRIWDVSKDRNLFARFVYFWTFLTLGLFIASIAISLLAKLKISQNLIGVNSNILGLEISTQFIGWSSKIIFCFCLYKLVPNCHIRPREALIGATISGTLFHIAVYVYTYYASDLSSYKTLYGAFAAVPIFLGWIYIIWIILLFGALIARRVRLGLISEKENMSSRFGRGVEAAIKRYRFRSLLPFVGLMATYQRFYSGRGTGLTCSELAKELEIPDSWLSEAFEILEKLGLVLTHQEKDRKPSLAERCYVPAKPPEAVSMKELNDQLMSPLQDWLEIWLGPEMGALRESFNRFIRQSKECDPEAVAEGGSRTIETLIRNNARKPPA